MFSIPNLSPAPDAAAQKPSVWADMREGLRFVWDWPGLTIVLVMAALLNLFGVPCLSFIPLLVTNHFQMGALELGWLCSYVSSTRIVLSNLTKGKQTYRKGVV
jgi:hypothetical protein